MNWSLVLKVSGALLALVGTATAGGVIANKITQNSMAEAVTKKISEGIAKGVADATTAQAAAQAANNNNNKPA